MRNTEAKQIAAALLLDLKVGRIAKLGIEEIEAAIKVHPLCPANPHAYGMFCDAVTRAVVEGAA